MPVFQWDIILKSTIAIRNLLDTAKFPSKMDVYKLPIVDKSLFS